MTDEPPVIFIKDNESYMPMRVKACTYCGVEKPVSDFNKHRITPDGLDHTCRDCANKRTRAFRSTPSGIYTAIKGRQTYNHKLGLGAAKPFNLGRGEFVAWYNLQEKQCVYCSIPEKFISLMREKWGDVTERLTIDCRVDSVGYRIDNLVLCCPKCNLVKQNILTYEEMLYVGQNFIKPKWLKLLNGRTIDG